MIYLVGWGLLYSVIIISSLTKYRGKVLLVPALLVFAVISILRGNVGTDTGNYEHMLLSFASEEGWQSIEPGFFTIGWLLVKLVGSAEIAVRSISLVFFILIFVFLFRADRNESFLLMVYILPVFAYPYSMNGLRIGLGSMLLMLAVQEARRRSYFKGSAIAVSALMFHYSIFFSLSFVSLYIRRWVRLSNLLVVIIAAFFSAIIFYLNLEYISYKFLIYEATQSPSIFSGLSKILIVFVILLGVSVSSISFSEKLKIIIPASLLTGVFWVVACYSYAGLRLLDLISFVLPLSILVTYYRLGLLLDMSIRFSFFLGGLMGATAVYRGFILESGQGPTPFLPYHFINLLF